MYRHIHCTMYIHRTMSCILYMPVYMHVLLRDEKEGRKEEARKIKHVLHVLFVCSLWRDYWRG